MSEKIDNSVDFERLQKVITATLDEGNPFSTVEWDFNSKFDDTRKQERGDFCDVVIVRMKNREPWKPGADWTYLPRS